MLRACVHRFAIDLNKLSQHIKNRTASQIRTTLKKKAFEDAGIPVRQVSSTVTNCQTPSPTPQPSTPTVSQLHRRRRRNKGHRLWRKYGIDGMPKVTLNMLNATENEVDVEGLTGDVKLEFEPADEVAT
ncbi:uncharacterized protein LOC114366048 isoform X6 [Ostrinia furnacalis]|nr:uncharacterized protein LOC114366048 isoform X6 [Ostrinia furnacalis]